ncbi:MAG: radical SAM protein, partial [bacterium]|nr:radical SAM protein [bacterium]
MRISDMFYAGSAFLRVVFFKQTIPLAVSYLITNRCNYSCSYCGRWRKKEPELATDQIIFMIDELAKLGTRFLQVTGGEPFLRP